MRLSRYILPTLKEDPSDAVVMSHRLMIRAGLIRKESAGMYIYLPLGWRVLAKIINIVREEMDRAGALEFLMPELTSADLWRESGRWNDMGPEMFRVRDRNGVEYALAPTHEEAFTGVMRGLISSYRDLPKNVYQINTKFRDEIRPRFGVIRSKEFIMKDAYSFDMDDKGLEESYQTMRKTYRRIFERCGLETIPVEADTGAMGGRDSEEFMVPSEVGEEVLLLCGSCGYRANRERAEYMHAEKKQGGNPVPLSEVPTPDVKTIDDLTEFFKRPAGVFLKSIIYEADGAPLMAVVTGDREINEQKLARAAGAGRIELGSEEVVERVTGAPVGFAGPVTKKNFRMLHDLAVMNVVNGITGANKKDVHFTGVNPGRDFLIREEADISFAEEGDACPKCGSPMSSKKGIEVGHIFKLEYKYTKAMNVTVLNEEGAEITPIMGTYGIGINRTMAAVVEQHNDDKGIMWPRSVAPFEVHLTGLGKSETEIRETDAIYETLLRAGFEVLYDDRKASPGYKFADADLIGLPVRVTVGKHYFQDGEIEAKRRGETKIHRTKKDGLVDLINSLLSAS
jgi:prolyl-tRNA synthetase